MVRFKPYIHINIEIADFSLGKKLDEIAVKYGGTPVGSGYGLGYRNVSYEFTRLMAARKFYIHAKRLSKVREIDSNCHLHEDDN